jgi:hypothetical protein
MVSGTDQTFEIYIGWQYINGYQGSTIWNVVSLTAYTLTIGGQSITLPAVQTAPSNMPFVVTWDTTHFNCPGTSGVSEKIELDATYTLYNPPNQPGTINLKVEVPVTVYNVGFASEIPFANANDPTADQVYQSLTGMNYFATEALQARQADCLGQAGTSGPIATSTVYYFTGHGLSSPAEFGDTCADDPANYPWQPPVPWWITSDQVAAKRSISTTPLMSFVFLDSCYTGMTDAMYQAFLTPGSSTPIDRAQLAYTEVTPYDWVTVMGPGVFTNLQNGYTVQDAVAKAWATLLKSKLGDAPPQGTAWTACLTVFGDKLTRLRGLYTGATGANTAWYSVTSTNASQSPTGG